MTRKHAIAVFESLSHSQGFYGRLLRQMQEMSEDELKQFDKAIKNVETDLDLILLIEQ